MLDLKQLSEHMRALDEADDVLQRQAFHALRNLEEHEWKGAPQAMLHALVVSLRDHLLGGMKPPVVHKDIAAILINMGKLPKAAVPQLTALLQEGIPNCVREAVLTVLARHGKDALSAVDRLLELANGKMPVAGLAVRTLGEIGSTDQQVRTALVSLLLSSNHCQDLQIQVAITLCRVKIKTPGLISYLAGQLSKNQDDGIRLAATQALAWCDKSVTDVVPVLLLATLNDKSEEVRLSAQAALDNQRLTRDEAIHLCARQLADSTYAEPALRKCGQAAVPELTQVLEDSVAATRMMAARILACFGELSVAAVPALKNALHDRKPDVRLAAAKSIWNITKDASVTVPVLVRLLEEKRTTDSDDAEARRQYVQTVIEALWRIGPAATAAVPALLEKAKDKNRMISESAQHALKNIAPARPK